MFPTDYYELFDAAPIVFLVFSQISLLLLSSFQNAFVALSMDANASRTCVANLTFHYSKVLLFHYSRFSIV